MRPILAMIAIFLTSTAFSADLMKDLGCHQTLVSSVGDQFNPNNGFLICDGKARDCHLVFGENDFFSTQLPSKATYTINEIEYDMTTRRETLEHRLIKIQNPKTKESHLLDVFWGPNKRAFARVVLQGNEKAFTMVQFKKSSPKNFNSKIKNRIKRQMDLLEKMIKTNSGQPGKSEMTWKREWKARLAGCKNTKRGQKLLSMIKN